MKPSAPVTSTVRPPKIGVNSALSSASASSVHWLSVGCALTGADSLARPG